MFTLDTPIDRRILLQAESLALAGHKVVIAAPGASGSLANVSFFDTCPVCNRVADTTGTLFRAGYELTQWLHEREINPRFAKGVYWRWFGDLKERFVKQFESAIEQLDGDIFVAHDLPLLPVAVEAARRHGGKIVYDSHELFAEQEFGRLEKANWRDLERQTIGKADLVITINDGIATELARRYSVTQPTIVMNCERRFSRHEEKRQALRRSHGFGPETKLLLFQGFFLKHRNIDTLIKAMPLLTDQNIVLALLGDGPDVERLKKLARRLRTGPRVRFLGQVPQEDLLDYTVMADAGIIPYRRTSLNNILCTPNKLFEFTAARVPIISSSLPQIEDLLTKHGNGLTGDMDMPERAARLIERFFADFLSDPELEHRLAEAAKNLSWEQESRKLLKAYAGL